VTTTAYDETTRAHEAERPSWDCVVCLQPWPCAIAKNVLISEFYEFPAVLAVYMSARMCDALRDLTADGSPRPLDLRERFLGWTHLASIRPRQGVNLPPASARRPRPDRYRSPTADPARCR